MPPATPPAPVIWYSGRADDQDHALDLARSIGRQVQVPSSPDDLLRRLSGGPRPLALVMGEPERPLLQGGVLRAVKRSDSHVPIVYLGRDGGPDDELAVRRAGVHYYAPGSVRLDEVAAVVGFLARRDEIETGPGGERHEA